MSVNRAKGQHGVKRRVRLKVMDVGVAVCGWLSGAWDDNS
jgi:hypothetical protein